MTDPLTSAQMYDIEQAAMANGSVTGLELMDRAGKAVVKAIFETWPDLLNAPRRAGVLAGPGNNGGDGFVIANRLRDYGWDVEVFHFGDIDTMPPDAKTNALAYANAGGVVSPLMPHEGRDWRFVDPPTDIWIDAVFGIGLTRPLPDVVASAFASVATESPDSKFVAVDILSGINADTGDCLTKLPVHPDMTVTFHAPKVGHAKGEGANWTGQLIVKDIGL